ncbi:MAG: hypothetical protein HZC41_17945 [Chloroflexi bacterium]|nr:hypothetical protein [Chloroflexota bacterium]
MRNLYPIIVLFALLSIVASSKVASSQSDVMECLNSRAGITVEEAIKTMTAEEILMHRPFVPTDIELFNPSVYPDGSEMQPPRGEGPTESEVLNLLRDYLEDEFPQDQQAQLTSLVLFNDPDAVATIPSPTLRAGMVALRATLAEPAIDVILHGETANGKALVASVQFNDDLPSNVFGTVSYIDPMTIEINGFGRADYPFMFTRTLAHEPLHSDSFNGVYEEGILTALDTLVYLEQLSRHPEMATIGTQFARFHNANALARLNSGTGSDLGLYKTNGGIQIFPCSATITFTSFWERYRDNPAFEVSPGNELLGLYLERLQEPGKPVCLADKFDKGLVDCIDQNQNAVTDEEIVAAAAALKLALPAE